MNDETVHQLCKQAVAQVTLNLMLCVCIGSFACIFKFLQVS